jgi:hypothetical protein
MRGIGCGRLVEAILYVNTIVNIIILMLPSKALGFESKHRDRNLERLFSMGQIAVTIILFGLFSHPSKTFDLSSDFSLKNNPKHVWQYGYPATESLAPDHKTNCGDTTGLFAGVALLSDADGGRR